jgi:hypothetical protein
VLSTRPRKPCNRRENCGGQLALSEEGMHWDWIGWGKLGQTHLPLTRYAASVRCLCGKGADPNLRVIAVFVTGTALTGRPSL